MNSVMVTGSTGLIGQTMVKKLLKNGYHVIAVVRDMKKGESVLGKCDRLQLLVAEDVREVPIKDMGIDYMIHAAANTSSKAFIENPIEIINTAFDSTKRMLEIARLNKLKGFVYLSSMEVYGTPETDDLINEDSSTNLNTMNVRSCYPESKRICEALCSAYASQYNIPAKVVRLTQTFGPGVKYDDQRVFAQFARCAIEGLNITLKTKGETKRSYLYTEDAAEAIMTVMEKGEIGVAYNAANEETYCSIYEMAELIANDICNGRIKVIVDEQDITKFGYAPTLHMNLDTARLRELGWTARYGLADMFKNLISDMKRNRQVTESQINT